jgi:hypothetical protein
MLQFHAQARQADGQDAPDEIALGGTRNAAKSHAVLAQVGLDDCQRVPGSKWLWLRKVMKSAAESMDDLVIKVLSGVDHEYTPSNGEIQFPNGSRILIGGFNNESDIDKYLGLEYDGVVKEECTQLSDSKNVKIDGSIRSSIPGYRVRKYYTTNPDGVGLSWFKRKFYNPWREKREQYTRFFFCSYKDNPFCSPEYKRYLNDLYKTNPRLAKAWEAGDFEAFEGQVFSEWDRSRHVVKPFAIPAWWPRRRAIDWGYAAPFVCLWVARNPDNRRDIVYRQVRQPGLLDRQQAALIREYSGDETYTFSYGDPSMWAKKTSGVVVTSTVEQYAIEGVYLTKGDNDRIGGVRKVHSALGDLPDGQPGIVFFEGLHITESLPELMSDPNNPEDVDTTGDDHDFDALKYSLTNTTGASRQPQSKEQSPLVGIGVI